MANTDITLFNDNGIFVPSVPSVAVVSGDTISFTASDHKPVVLFFSPDAVAALSPKPTNPFPIGVDKKADFTFSSSKPGAYSVFFGTSDGSGPRSFPSAISQRLTLEINAINVAPSFGSPHDTTSPGS